MNPVTEARSSIASAAANGIAGLISLTRTGILAHPNRVRAEIAADFAFERPIGDCTAVAARILDVKAHLR
jgi:hypothetical protein